MCDPTYLGQKRGAVLSEAAKALAIDGKRESNIISNILAVDDLQANWVGIARHDRGFGMMRAGFRRKGIYRRVSSCGCSWLGIRPQQLSRRAGPGYDTTIRIPGEPAVSAPGAPPGAAEILHGTA